MLSYKLCVAKCVSCSIGCCCCVSCLHVLCTALLCLLLLLLLSLSVLYVQPYTTTTALLCIVGKPKKVVQKFLLLVTAVCRSLHVYRVTTVPGTACALTISTAKQYCQLYVLA
jgi:hypothetical protein